MTTPPDTTAHDALDFQARQLRMILERLATVRDFLPNGSIDWRGPAQQHFDAGIADLHRELARASTLIQSAEHRTTVAAQQVMSHVG